MVVTFIIIIIIQKQITLICIWGFKTKQDNLK